MTKDTRCIVWKSPNWTDKRGKGERATLYHVVTVDSRIAVARGAFVLCSVRGAFAAEISFMTKLADNFA